jgi:hypothetical protein
MDWTLPPFAILREMILAILLTARTKKINKEEWENNPTPTREREGGPVSRDTESGCPGESPKPAARKIDTAKINTKHKIEYSNYYF